MGRLGLMAISIAIFAGPALAESAPDMIGKWTGTSRAVVHGPGGHYGEGEATPVFREVPLTIEWTEQNDGRLIGTITSSAKTEPKVAVLSSDGKTLFTADADGSSVGRLVDNDHFELCYMQSSISDDQIVVSCVDFERVEE